MLLPGNIRTEETVRSVELNDDVVIGNGSNVIGAITYKLQDRIVGASDIVYYETEDGMTDAVFKNMWPNFLIPVDVAFSGVDMSTLELSRTGKPEAPQSIGDVIDLRKAAPWAIGLGGAAAVLLIGLLAVAISKRRSGR